MVDMLADPSWIPIHVAILIGLCLMAAGLFVFRRDVEMSPRLSRWLGFAVVMTMCEILEMAVHTVAFVNADELAAGTATPVLTTHLSLATIFYTPYAISMIGAIWLGQRERVLGSPWYGWIGLFGASAHGVVMWLAIVLKIGPAGILFPCPSGSCLRDSGRPGAQGIPPLLRNHRPQESGRLPETGGVPPVPFTLEAVSRPGPIPLSTHPRDPSLMRDAREDNSPPGRRRSSPPTRRRTS